MGQCEKKRLINSLFSIGQELRPGFLTWSSSSSSSSSASAPRFSWSSKEENAEKITVKGPKNSIYMEDIYGERKRRGGRSLNINLIKVGGRHVEKYLRKKPNRFLFEQRERKWKREPVGRKSYGFQCDLCRRFFINLYIEESYITSICRRRKCNEEGGVRPENLKFSC